MPHLVGLINQLTSKSQLQLWPGTKVRQQLTVSYWPGADPQPEPEPKPESESESGLKNLFSRGVHIFEMIYEEYLARRPDGNYATDLVRGAMRCDAMRGVKLSEVGLGLGRGLEFGFYWSRWMLKASDSIF